jgi:hypothetical protein
MFTPFSVTLLVFHELMNVPRLLDCQQNVPAPSKVNGAVMVEVTGLQAPVTAVGVGLTVGVRVGVRVGVGGVPVTEPVFRTIVNGLPLESTVVKSEYGGQPDA